MSDKNEINSLPQSPLQMIDQARDAVQRGLKMGHCRQRLQLILPVNEKQYDFLASDPVDYPCNLKTEFESCCSLTRAILEGVTGKQDFMSKRLDDGGVEGEPCAAIYPESKDFVAVVYPTADRLKDLRDLSNDSDRPLLMVNSQWNDAGQVLWDPLEQHSSTLLNVEVPVGFFSHTRLKLLPRDLNHQSIVFIAVNACSPPMYNCGFVD